MRHLGDLRIGLGHTPYRGNVPPSLNLINAGNERTPKTMTKPSSHDLGALMFERFGEDVNFPDAANAPLLGSMAARGSCRKFTDASLDPDLIRALCAIALSSPTKSDLQQRDLIVVSSPVVRTQLAKLVGGQKWVADVPLIIVFCGNNRRQRLVHEWRDRPFVNDHLDAFFNAAVDAGIALSAFVTAAEAMGLGTCPISAVRNEPDAVSELLGLPEHVFPVAGLAVGYPAVSPVVAHRLPLNVTVHTDGYSEPDLQQAIETYDARRRAAQHYATQRSTEQLGADPEYSWSEDKARQYSLPERADFGAFVRRKGFNLD